MSDLKKIAPATYLMEKENAMLVPGLVIATEEILSTADIDKPLDQVRNVATIEGIVGYSIAMPDIHWGYGFPIGGVAATDAEHGVISPGGVGYDINCGVRLAVTKHKFSSLSKKDKEKLLKNIFSKVPSGVGGSYKNGKGLSDSDYAGIFKYGSKWSIDHGFGLKEDLLCTESHGRIGSADIEFVSKEALTRGKNQLGTIGSGNHFVEIGAISTIYDPQVAKAWDIEEGDTYILIHSGSRGFGHQVCQDSLNEFTKAGLGKHLPDKQLIAAPINSELGLKYFKAMAAAANYAFNNRQCILHAVRLSFSEVLGIQQKDVRLIYDVCHNIAKFETYEINGKQKKLCVHRKGATRAFGPGAEELPDIYKATGQPVLVPGDMGRASHLMVGLGNPMTFCSCCHGAGRYMSRKKSSDFWAGKDPVEHMQKLGTSVMATSLKTISEEMPQAYKDVDMVVKACQDAGLANMVAKLKPSLVIKG